MKSEESHNIHEKHAKLVKPNWEGATPSLNGLVLAGGASQRMGRDKRAIEYHGVSQLDYLTELLQEYVDEVFISCHPDRMANTTHKILKDTFLDLGPYGGVLSAFRFNPNVAWLTVPVDMPLLDAELISQLIKDRDATRLATCFHDPSTGFPEPLLTIWEPRAYPVLLQNISQGISCLRRTLINSDAKVLTMASPEKLRNANTVEEMEEMQTLIEAKAKA